MTAGLSSAPACVRVIIRDVAGKHSWDSAVLYGPPPCSPNSPTHPFFPRAHSPHSANLHLRTPPGGPPKKVEANREDGEEEQEGREAEEGGGGMEGERQGFQTEGEEGEERRVGGEEKGDRRGGEGDMEEDGEKNENRAGDGGEAALEALLAPPLAKRVCREAVPAWDSLTEEDDALDEMLQYLGYSSPECLQRAGTHTHTKFKTTICLLISRLQEKKCEHILHKQK